MGWYSRRLFLQVGGVAALGALLSGRSSAGARAVGAAPEGAFEVLRRRWRDVSVGAGFDAAREPYRSRLADFGAKAVAYGDAMEPAAGSLWRDQPFPSFVATPGRLRAMARAYVLPGTGVTGDAGLAATVAAGVDHYRRLVYAAGAEPYGNWWHWRIGVPGKLLDAALLIGPHLGDARRDALRDAVDHFVPESVLDHYSDKSTGANRVDLCVVTLLRAMLTSDPGRAARAVAALSPVFPYVTEGDGFYRDGSFIQHTTVPYQGAYGVSLLSGVATLLAVLRGTPWEVADPNRQVVFDAVERSFAPFVHDGFCMDLVRGRGVARTPYGDHERGREIAAAVLLLGESASGEERARWRGMVKGWALRDTERPMLTAAESSDLAFHARLAAILDDDTVPASAEPPGHRLMTMSARAVHRRPGWCAALSMASHRVGHYEHGNGENLRGWHTGSGMLYWWAGGHGAQYSDSFWTTVDPYRLPGTTVSTLRLPDGAGEGWGDTCPPGRWVGGATDGVYATVGQHLNGLESTMEAFKSWFFLDDAVVCLGAGITGADGVPVETIVDNRRTDALLTVDEREGWAHLDGHGGYVLLACPRLRTLREERTGPGSVTRSYATLWLDHGADPVSASYAYVLLPGAGRAGTRARATAAGWVRVLDNTARRQGVHVPSLGITAVNFWHAGTSTGTSGRTNGDGDLSDGNDGPSARNNGASGGDAGAWGENDDPSGRDGGGAGALTASAPCAVLVREQGDGIATLTVSDPRRTLDELTVTWHRPVTAVLLRDPHLTAATTGPELTLTFERLADQSGTAKTITVRTV
ncbi:polysaccharide lyase 8 family protein [Sphaerisporangium sp. NPDC051011]|uniref:polysaccharide lyase 8 family protein n=1 Tax=Sphaerisporangium sp. NPDC051011 TaxID=3155792 RepID=UPI0033F3371D